MLVLNKKAKILILLAAFAVIVSAGFLIEKLEKDAFVVEVAAGGDGEYISDSEQVVNGKININSASETELVKLNGIGPALAKRIIKYRSEHGPFETTEEVMKVQGISGKKYEEIRDFICAE